MDFKIKIRIIFWSALVILTSWFVYLGVVPGGKITYATDFKDNNYFFGRLTPEERTNSTSSSEAITGEPVYFSLSTPRKFDQAKLTITYKNESSAPLIEAGVLTDKTVWNYDLKPVENKILENLQTQWAVSDGNGLALLQRIKKYGNIEEFLKNLPPTSEIALYNYDLKTDFKIPDYKPGASIKTFNIPLKGPYQFYTYIKGEELNFKFIFSDLNQNKDPDPIDLNLYKDGKLIAAKHLDDDGIADDSGELKKDRELGLSVSGLKEGVYQIELKCDSDIVTRNIKTGQQKIAFINKIWLADDYKKNINLVTDSRVMAAETTNPGRLQKIVFGGRKLEVKETFKQFGLRAIDKISEIKLEKDDVILSGDGMFGFDSDSFFDPVIAKLNENTDVDQDGINYILTSYQAPTVENGHKTAEADFDLTKAYRENGKYNFLISVPKLGTPGYGGRVLVESVKVDLRGKTIWQFLKNFINRLNSNF